MLTRRAALLSPLALAAARTVSFAQGGMTLAMHQNTSSGAGYRGSLEGWARAGIRHVELNAGLVDQFLETDTMAAARRVLTDNGLTPVSGSVGVGGLWEPNPDHAAALETLRRRCEMFAELGLEKVYGSTGANGTFSETAYDAAVANVRQAGADARGANHARHLAGDVVELPTARGHGKRVRVLRKHEKGLPRKLPKGKPRGRRWTALATFRWS